MYDLAARRQGTSPFFPIIDFLLCFSRLPPTHYTQAHAHNTNRHAHRYKHTAPTHTILKYIKTQIHTHTHTYTHKHTYTYNIETNGGNKKKEAGKENWKNGKKYKNKRFFFLRL